MYFDERKNKRGVGKQFRKGITIAYIHSRPTPFMARLVFIDFSCCFTSTCQWYLNTLITSKVGCFNSPHCLDILAYNQTNSLVNFYSFWKCLIGPGLLKTTYGSTVFPSPVTADSNNDHFCFTLLQINSHKPLKCVFIILCLCIYSKYCINFMFHSLI